MGERTAGTLSSNEMKVQQYGTSGASDRLPYDHTGRVLIRSRTVLPPGAG